MLETHGWFHWLCVLGWRGVGRNVMDERQGGSVISFMVNFKWSFTHTFHSAATVNTRLCLIYRSQDTGAVYTTDTSLSLIWENHAQCRKVSDRCLLWVWHSLSCLWIHRFYQTSHTPTHSGIWKYFPLFVSVLFCVVFGFGHMPGEAMLDVLSSHKAERIIECTGQGEVMFNWGNI